MAEYPFKPEDFTNKGLDTDGKPIPISRQEAEELAAWSNKNWEEQNNTPVIQIITPLQLLLWLTDAEKDKIETAAAQDRRVRNAWQIARAVYSITVDKNHPLTGPFCKMMVDLGVISQARYDEFFDPNTKFPEVSYAR